MPNVIPSPPSFILVVEASQPGLIVQKQNTRNFYHKRMKDGVRYSFLKRDSLFVSYLVYLLLVADAADLVAVEVDAEEAVVGPDGDAVAVHHARRERVLHHHG